MFDAPHSTLRHTHTHTHHIYNLKQIIKTKFKYLSSGMGRRKYFQWMWLKKSFDIVCRTIVVELMFFACYFVIMRGTLTHTHTQIFCIYLLDLRSFSHKFLFIYFIWFSSLRVAVCGLTESTNSNIKISKCRSNGNEVKRKRARNWYIKRGKWKWQNKRNHRTSSGIINITENKVSVMLMMCVYSILIVPLSTE